MLVLCVMSQGQIRTGRVVTEHRFSFLWIQHHLGIDLTRTIRELPIRTDTQTHTPRKASIRGAILALLEQDQFCTTWDLWELLIFPPREGRVT